MSESNTVYLVTHCADLLGGLLHHALSQSQGESRPHAHPRHTARCMQSAHAHEPASMYSLLLSLLSLRVQTVTKRLWTRPGTEA